MEADRQQRYFRRSYLLLHGIPENKKENTDDLALKVFNNKMKIKFTEGDINRLHRLDETKTNNKSRPVIVKLVIYNERKNRGWKGGG